jgi:RHS repeat-associated protein
MIPSNKTHESSRATTNGNSSTATPSARFVRLLTVLVLILLAARQAAPQGGGATPPNAAPGAPAGSYSLSGFESVNLFNGRLNFALPLLKVGGRGAAQVPITLTLNPVNWKVEREGMTNGGGDCNPLRNLCPAAHTGTVHTITHPSEMTYLVWNGGWGWHRQPLYWTEEAVMQIDGTMISGTNDPYEEAYYYVKPNAWQGVRPGYGPGILQGRIEVRTKSFMRLTRLVFTAPDGTEYELRDQLKGGQPIKHSSTAGPTLRGTVFASADGTGVTFISDSPVTDQPSDMGAYPASDTLNDGLLLFNPSGTLLFPDGTRYRIYNGLVSWGRDRNGNLITFAYGTDPNSPSYRQVITITDSLGRTVRIVYGMPDTASETPDDPTDVYDQIAFDGFGAERKIKVWRSSLGRALLEGTLKTYAQLFPEYEQEPAISSTAHDLAGVATSVQLPDNRRYEFKYNAHGEVVRVTLPTGGALRYEYGTLSGPFSVQRRVLKRQTFESGDDAAPESTQAYSMEFSTDLNLPHTTTVTVEHKAGAGGPDDVVLTRGKHHFHGNSNSLQNGFYSPWMDGLEFLTEQIDPATGVTLRSVRRDFRQRAPIGWYTAPAASPPNDPRLVETVATLENGLMSKQTSINPADSTVGFDRYNNRTDLWEYDYKAEGEQWRLLRHTRTKYLTVNPVNGKDYACDPDTACGDGASPDNVIHIRSLPEEQWANEEVGDANKRALTRYEYDDYTDDGHLWLDGNPRQYFLTPRPGISGLCLALDLGGSCARQSDADYKTRGNLTSSTAYLLANTGAELSSVASYSQYDVAGNVVKSIDGRGNPTEFKYEDNFGSPSDSARDLVAPPGLNGKKAFAFATEARNALGHAIRSQYDYHTGAVVNVEDANGTVISLNYGQGDPLDRLTQVVRAANYPESSQNLRSQTTYAYDDDGRKITTTSDLRAYGDNLLKADSFYDGLGRTTEARRYEDPTRYVATLTKYDALGRAAEVSNPFRPLAQPAESPVWTATEYDALGRVTVVATKADGAKVYMLYDGERTMVTDQDGKQRITKSDALERLTDVWEVTAADPATVQVSFPVPQGFPHRAPAAGYRTSYGYDVLGHLRRVEQGEQRRHYAYDSLGRLLRASNPEQEANTALVLPANMLNCPADAHNAWSLAYGYDEAGNLKKRTDARGVETSYEYDALGRVTDRSYTDVQLSHGGAISTPSIKYFYDDQALPAGAPAFSRGKSIGRLVAVTYGGAASTTGSYRGNYDELGRARYSSQVAALPDAAGQPAPQTPYVFGYEYNLDGSLKSETYPSGRVVESEYDAVGRLAGVKKQGGDYYAGGDPTEPGRPNVISYTAHGAVAALRLGNGLWEHTSYNERLQPFEIGLGTSQTDSSKLKLEYGYAPTVGGIEHSARNSGNVWSQRISVPAAGVAPAQTFTQTYTYDALNRLETANESNGSVSTWAQVYTYDRFGNRRLDQAQTTTPKLTEPSPTALEEVANPKLQPLTNRITEDQNGDGNKEYTYDQAGNLTCSASHCAPADSPTLYFAYDGENKMVRAGGGPQAGGSEYVYDGEGKRVRKAWGAKVTVYIYDATGKLAAEYSNQPPHGGTNYLTQDHLDNTRVVTDTQGNAHSDNGGSGSRHDYLPFGEEIGIGVGGRSTDQGYTHLDRPSQQFTGAERDKETNLDYMKARYYSALHGRFTSPDDFRNDTHSGAPASWNLYVYARNNPLANVDMNGKWVKPVHDLIIERAFRGWSKAHRQLLKDISAWMDGGEGRGDSWNPKNFHQHSQRMEYQSPAEAAKQAQTFIVNLKLKADGTKDLNEKLTLFAKALHTVTDNTSPEHEHFKGFPSRKGGALGQIDDYVQTAEHGFGETMVQFDLYRQGMAAGAADVLTEFFFGAEEADRARNGVALGSSTDPRVRAIQGTSVHYALKAQDIDSYRRGIEEGRRRTRRLIYEGSPGN